MKKNRKGQGAVMLAELRAGGFGVRVEHSRRIVAFEDGAWVPGLYGGATSVIIYDPDRVAKDGSLPPSAVLATGEAICHPEERFDRRLGLTIAVGRARKALRYKEALLRIPRVNVGIHVVAVREGWAVTVDGALLHPGPSQALFNHSPDGFAWGYSGSGPAQLALALLLAGGVDGGNAIALHQEFKEDTVAEWPEEGWSGWLDPLGWARLHSRYTPAPVAGIPG